MAAAGPSINNKRFTEARVIRILSNKEIIINKGAQDGVNIGDKFNIGSSLGEIVDNITNESLGNILHIKQTLESTSVYPRFSILSNVVAHSTNSQFNLSLANAAAKTMATSLYGTSMKSIEPFDVNKEEIDPLYKDRKSEITLGDIATFKK